MRHHPPIAVRGIAQQEFAKPGQTGRLPPGLGVPAPSVVNVAGAEGRVKQAAVRRLAALRSATRGQSRPDPVLFRAGVELALNGGSTFSVGQPGPRFVLLFRMTRRSVWLDPAGHVGLDQVRVALVGPQEDVRGDDLMVTRNHLRNATLAARLWRRRGPET